MIQMRDPINPDWFWMNPYSLAFDHMCVSDLLCIDQQGNAVMGGREGNGQICESGRPPLLCILFIHVSTSHLNVTATSVSHTYPLPNRADTCSLDNAAGFSIHGTILDTRKDINSVAHSHSIFGKAFSMLGRNIDIGTYGEYATALPQACFILAC
jgi:ribulose-5-phosphate 4-epimerase/fuculose-1-phosphate aldolase